MKYLLTILTVSLCLSVIAQDNIGDHYRIYDTHTKQVISIDKIVADMANADVLFFGEEHNDSACHYLENQIWRALHGRYGDKVTLSLEMIESDGQLALDEYLAAFIDESRFSKDVRLWSNYKDYRPMVEYAKQNKLPVLAANAPRRYVSLVSKRGMKALDSLSEDAKEFLPPLPYDTLPGRYREKFIEVMQGSPGANNPNVYYSQNLWDASMSYSIYRYLKNNRHRKVFHCVGGFHTAEKLGTAAQLQMRNRKLRILNIAAFSDKSFPTPDWSKFSDQGDYIIITDPDLKKTF
jgi:uncharacterized iron-regulated protein